MGALDAAAQRRLIVSPLAMPFVGWMIARHVVSIC
jgi:hypothetical protein